MGDAVSLNANGRVAQSDVIKRKLTEVGSALAHHDGYEIHCDSVEEVELEALPGDRPRGHRNGAVSRYLLGKTDRSGYAVGDEVERGVGVSLDPVRRHLVRDDDHRYVHGVPAAPSFGEVEQRAAADERT